MGERCANTWVCLAITFIGISITLVGIICWREFITRIFTTHQFFTNIDGVVREIVQFNDSLLLIYMPQVFFQEECRQAIHCTGCICHYIAQATSAVVYKSGYTSATARYISQLEIDLFYLHGCCKCINLSKRAP
ncbi:uncharacterized protein LOC127718916 isoform X2 [Mytilus californianus]|uniref:uncharacterized protein LOC127718916 isoform X2 n=1 Tax=Mytilus californianus TaxID=6549 RepID=UPI002247EEBB|nr:uncharacterized protein LOC127718916 isoform X2 [Mytilus californianus]